MTFDTPEPFNAEDAVAPPGGPDPTEMPTSNTVNSPVPTGTSAKATEPTEPTDNALMPTENPAVVAVPEPTAEEIAAAITRAAEQAAAWAAAGAAAQEAARIDAEIEDARAIIERAEMLILAVDTTVGMPLSFTRQQIVAYQAAQYTLIADQATLQAVNMAITARLVEASRIVALRLAELDEADPAGAADRPEEWSALRSAMAGRTTSLGAKLGLTDASISKLTLTSQMLVQDLPEALAALEEGSISMKHADILADHASQMPREVRGTFDAVITPVAKETLLPRMSGKARAAREKLHPTTHEERHTTAAKKRCVLYDAGKDGMATITAYIPAIAAKGIINRLTETGKALKGKGKDRDERTLAQLRADVFQDFLLNGEACQEADANITARILVLVDHSTLMGDNNNVAHLDGYGAIGAEQVRTLASRCDQLVRVIHNPVTKEILNVGTKSYQGRTLSGARAITKMVTDRIIPNQVITDTRRVSQAMRELMWLRDQTCRWIGCGRSAHSCELDHTIAVEEGGATSVENLAFLCKFHHRVKHNTQWQMTQQMDGVLHFTDPTGASYATYPAMMLNLLPAEGVSTVVSDTEDFVPTWDDGTEIEDSEWVNGGMYDIPTTSAVLVVSTTSNDDEDEPLPF